MALLNSTSLAGTGVVEGELGRRAGTVASSREPRAPLAVHGIADQRMADRARGGLGSGACGRSPAGTRATPASAGRVELLQHAVLASAPACRRRRPPSACGSPWIAPDRRVDHTVSARQDDPTRARCSTRVAVCDANWATSASAASLVRATTSRPELPTSRRCTMPGRCGSPDAGDLGKAGQQPVDERAVGVAGAGMDDEPGRLVDDDHVVVDVDDAELDRRVRPPAGVAPGTAPGRPRPPGLRCNRTLPIVHDLDRRRPRRRRRSRPPRPTG